MIHLAIDSSTSKCGIAVFDSGKLVSHLTKEFPGIWDQQKLTSIAKYFEDLISDLNPDSILIEEPLVFAKQSRSVAMLNQVGGAIFTVAVLFGKTVSFFHGQKVKKYLKFKTKQESIAIAEMTHSIIGISEHEADAINLYDAYTIQGAEVVTLNIGFDSNGQIFKHEENKTKPVRKDRKAKPTSKQRD